MDLTVVNRHSAIRTINQSKHSFNTWSIHLGAQNKFIVCTKLALNYTKAVLLFDAKIIYFVIFTSPHCALSSFITFPAHAVSGLNITFSRLTHVKSIF